ncbi:hypothetical protein SNE40_017297 [Patella caerulea]|uniref:Uncharacterized protein n=1 Tax=Patella caerulea TaxID=87958 RepID=A0AAN8JA54_PATCE
MLQTQVDGLRVENDTRRNENGRLTAENSRQASHPRKELSSPILHGVQNVESPIVAHEFKMPEGLPSVHLQKSKKVSQDSNLTKGDIDHIQNKRRLAASATSMQVSSSTSSDETLKVTRTWPEQLEKYCRDLAASILNQVATKTVTKKRSHSQISQGVKLTLLTGEK